MPLQNLVLCGGTGAHVGVAFIRLHTLGHLVGYFDHLDGFPQLFLIDQDAGSGSDGEKTAWDVAVELLNNHPGLKSRANLSFAISPLPKGNGNSWFAAPNNVVRQRFASSDLGSMLLSERQLDINMAQGMMASPAAGSLLFRLKTGDVDAGGQPADGDFGDLLTNRRGETAVFGSSVGGTGASVGPTVAKMLGNAGHSVLAVMILNWFKLTSDGSGNTKTLTQVRNDVMLENEASALSYYDEHLAKNIAVLPLGVPDAARRQRTYTGDLQQPITEHFVHGIAALAAFSHFDEPAPRGLYTYGTRSALSFDATVPTVGGRFQTLVDRAKWLISFANICEKAVTLGAPGKPEARLVQLMRGLSAKPDELGNELRKLSTHLQEQLSWVESTLNVQAKSHNQANSPTLESLVADFIKANGLQREKSDADTAYSILKWAGRYAQTLSFPLPAEGKNVEHQLPGLRFDKNAAAAPAPQHGKLTLVPQGQALISGLVEPLRLAVNGWPDPLAFATFFDYQIRNKAHRETRMLQLLLAGLATGEFRLQSVPTVDRPSDLTLEWLLQKAGQSDATWKGLASHRIVWPGRGKNGSDEVIGSTSPKTLLVPRPYMEETRDRPLWTEIAHKIAGVSNGWDDKDVFPLTAKWSNSLAPEICAAWCNELRQTHGSGSAPVWTQVFDDYPTGPARQQFYPGSSVAVQWGATTPLVSTPSCIVGPPVPPRRDLHKLTDSSAVTTVTALLASFLGKSKNQQPCTFNSVDFDLVTETGAKTVTGIWEQHLRELQLHRDSSGLIFTTYGENNGGLTLEVKWQNTAYIYEIDNAVLLSPERVFVSTVLKSQDRFPDLPLRAAYLGLARDGADSVVDRWRTQTGYILPQSGAASGPKCAVQGSTARYSDLFLRGMSAGLIHDCNIPADYNADGHWEVWPNFRTAINRQRKWKTYYLFQRGAGGGKYNPNLRVRPVWANDSGIFFLGNERLVSDKGQYADATAEPIGWDNNRAEAGAPIALSLGQRNGSDEEHGLYWVRLQTLAEGADFSLSVDFGTSHTAAAVKRGQGAAQVVKFGRRNGKLGLAVLNKPDLLTQDDSRAVWMPTESAEDNTIFLPTELATTAPVSVAVGSAEAPIRDDVNSWIPGIDFRIPVRITDKKVIEGYILSNFKWNGQTGVLAGKEAALRSKFLSHFLELVLAKVLASNQQAPAGQVAVTFLWPLRSTKAEARDLQAQMTVLLAELSTTVGIDLVLNGPGMLDESRAARVRQNLPNRYDFVADLGGGTLDVFLSGDLATVSNTPFVADSVKLGVNELLTLLCERDGYLPKEFGATPAARFSLLRSWIRNQGSPSLFSDDPLLGQIPDKSLGLSSFKDRADGKPARRLINRYFGVVADYVARTMVSYAQLLEQDPKQPAINTATFAIQLRGNGWRINYRDQTTNEFARAFCARVQARAAELSTLGGISSGVAEFFNNPNKAIEVLPVNGVDELKQYPVENTLNDNRPIEPDNSFDGVTTFTGVELTKTSPSQTTVPWFATLPLNANNTTDITFGGTFNPPILLATEEGESKSIKQLSAHGIGKMNRALQGGIFDQASHTLHVRMSEQVFESALDLDLIDKP